MLPFVGRKPRRVERGFPRVLHGGASCALLLLLLSVD